MERITDPPGSKRGWPLADIDEANARYDRAKAAEWEAKTQSRPQEVIDRAIAAQFEALGDRQAARDFLTTIVF